VPKMLTNVFFFVFYFYKIQEKSSPIQEINFSKILVAPEKISIAFFKKISGASHALSYKTIILKHPKKITFFYPFF
jgi:hypothetical protein